MDSSYIKGIEMENEQLFDCFYTGEPLISTSKLSFSSTESWDPLSEIFKLPSDPFFATSLDSLSHQNPLLLTSEKNEFDDFSFCVDSHSSVLSDFPFFDDDVMPLNTITYGCIQSDGIKNGFNEYPIEIRKESENYGKDDEESRGKRLDGRVRSCSIEFEEISKYFYVPITVAAKEMNVGLTALKKRCRELGISRWPHRKMKSLKSLIHHVQELGRHGGDSGEIKLRCEIEKLEEHKKLMEKMPELELNEETKRIRQACFKANYKKRRTMALI